MTVRSLKKWLVPLALGTVSIGSIATETVAATIYSFSGNYRTVVNITPIQGNISQVFEVGESDDAPYGLDTYKGLTYSVLDDSGNLTFNNDPSFFGVEDYPFGYIQLGDGTNTLFGTSDASVSVDFENLTAQGSGVVYITDGQGIFEGATATLSFSEEDIVSLGENITLNGLELVSGPIEVPHQVPEPTTTTALSSIGLWEISFQLYRRRK